MNHMQLLYPNQRTQVVGFPSNRASFVMNSQQDYVQISGGFIFSNNETGSVIIGKVM